MKAYEAKFIKDIYAVAKERVMLVHNLENAFKKVESRRSIPYFKKI